jgi:hypothetical protein
MLSGSSHLSFICTALYLPRKRQVIAFPIWLLYRIVHVCFNGFFSFYHYNANSRHP